MELLIKVSCAFLLAVFFHSLFCRLEIRLGVVSKFIVIGSIVGILLVGWQTYQYGFWCLPTIGAVIIYGFLCELYIFLFTMVLGSISTNLIVRLTDADMSREQIDQIYDSKQMVLNRLDRLVEADLLKQGDENLFLTAKGEKLAKMFHSFRSFFRHS